MQSSTEDDAVATGAQVTNISPSARRRRAAPLGTMVRERERKRQRPASGPATASGHLVAASDGTIEACHPSFALLAGRSPKDLIGRSITDVVDCGDERLLSPRNPVQRLSARLHRPSGGCLEITLRQFLRPGGSVGGGDAWVVLVEAPSAVVDAAARPDATSAEAPEPAVELEALRASFLRAVAHDLKNPLSIITGMGHTLADRQVELPVDSRIELAEAIARQGGRLLATLENLLALDRLALGRTRIVCRRIEVAPLVEEVVSALRDEQVAVRTELAPITAAVDAELFERIVENLARNAVEHQLTDEPVDVQLRRDAHDPDRFELRVLDRGPGIDPEEREQIFRPYFRGDRRGVGLSIVRAFARLHGGDVAVEARPGGGSVFVVSLPLDGDEAA